MTQQTIECRWKGRRISLDRYQCRSKKIVAPRGVTEEHCGKCHCRNHDPEPGQETAPARRTPRFRRNVGPEIRVKYCSPREVWDWAVTENGIVLDSGSEKDELNARREAEKFLSRDILNTENYSCESKRHLLFHLMPVSGNGAWQKNCDNLISRISVFNGRRMCAIVTGRSKYKLDHQSVVYDYMRGNGFEFIEVPNDTKLRETATWDHLWKSIEDRANSNDIVFRCHSKGVTRPDLESVRLWRDLMYEWLLDYMPAVEKKIEDKPVVGILQKFGRHFNGSRAQWFFSGSFYWVRVRDAFLLRGPQKIDRAWYGVESWPGVVWPREDAGCLHDPYPICDVSAYEIKSMNSTILPIFNKWKEENGHLKTKFTDAEVHNLGGSSQQPATHEALP